MLAMLVQDTTRYRIPLLLAGALTALVLAALLVLFARRVARRVRPGTPWWYYAGAAGGLAVSLNTSWRFFGDRLDVVGADRRVRDRATAATPGPGVTDRRRRRAFVRPPVDDL